MGSCMVRGFAGVRLVSGVMNHMNKELTYMQNPLQITFKDMDVSTSVYRRIEEKVAKLERHFTRMISCHVVISKCLKSASNKHLLGLFQVHIAVEMPGEMVVVERNPALKGASENMYLTIKMAFDTMERRLRAFIDKQRSHVKTHEAGPYGQVIRLSPQEECGFILTDDGRELYFHENSVVNNGLGRLAVGCWVRYAEEKGIEGPQASSVFMLRRARHTGLALAG